VCSSDLLFEDITGGSHVVQLNGTQSWTNYTFTPDLLIPGIHQCIWQARDRAANTNQTPVIQFTVVHVNPPVITNITYAPTSPAELDPNVTINVTANVTDTTAVSKVIIQYKESGAGGWSSAEMANIGGNLYRGSFVPTTENVWTFRVFANNTAGNWNVSAETNLTITYERNWTRAPASFGAVSGLINSNVSLGTIIVNNTGDAAITFEIDSVWLNAFFNESMPFTVPFNGTRAIAVSATALSTASQDDITFTIRALNTSTPQNATANATLVSYVSGPALYVTIETAPAGVAQGDSNINLLAKVKNIGNDTAADTWLAWNLPSGWSIGTGAQNVSIGVLGVGQSATNGVVVSIAGDATTGTQPLISTSVCTGTTGSASRNVYVSGITPPGPAPGPGGGGGGGAIAVTAPELVLSVPQTIEILIGQSESAIASVKNPSGYSDLQDLTITTSGSLSQYVTVEPSVINTLLPGQTKQFVLTVKAPSYLSEGKYPLTVKVSGTMKGTGVLVTKSATVDIVIYTSATERGNISIIDAENAIKNMTNTGFNVGRAEDLLNKAKEALIEKDFTTAKTYADEIIRLKEKAFAVNSAIEELARKIAEADTFGRETTESKAALELAKEAFSRGDYDKAEARLNSAALTFAIESNRINAAKLLVQWWWLFILAAIITAFLAATVWRELKLWLITRRLEALRREERVINELMTGAQKEYYKERTMPKLTFYRTMYEYEKRLERIRAMIANLTSERANMIRVVEELNKLEMEDKKLKDLIMELQRNYFEKGKISKELYTRHLRAYVARRSAIAQSKEAAKARLKEEERAPAEKVRKLWSAYNESMSSIEEYFGIRKAAGAKVKKEVTKAVTKPAKLPEKRKAFGTQMKEVARDAYGDLLAAMRRLRTTGARAKGEGVRTRLKEEAAGVGFKEELARITLRGKEKSFIRTIRKSVAKAYEGLRPPRPEKAKAEAKPGKTKTIMLEEAEALTGKWSEMAQKTGELEERIKETERNLRAGITQGLGEAEGRLTESALGGIKQKAGEAMEKLEGRRAELEPDVEETVERFKEGLGDAYNRFKSAVKRLSRRGAE